MGELSRSASGSRAPDQAAQADRTETQATGQSGDSRGSVFDDEDMHDVPGQVQLETQVMLLAALVAEARFGPAELDEFMTESRKLADRWMS
jgi:hypothetical protein